MNGDCRDIELKFTTARISLIVTGLQSVNRFLQTKIKNITVNLRISNYLDLPMMPNSVSLTILLKGLRNDQELDFGFLCKCLMIHNDKNYYEVKFRIQF
ncbi:hypothetical protein BpHYR1_054349 [Brachionus plicatilis]|uniref:Uncharacterized protein n=1 Tax=Brachionus plicatilis TaxID=10195 RepID=A0A3M7REP9_BRAPC|nr:hypothetical protein BpHYR1_054349 [Brachionus plicatilis]